MSSVQKLSWDDVKMEVQGLVTRASSRPHLPQAVYGVPTGGSFVALLASQVLNCKLLTEPPAFPPDVLIVDDIVDSGKTLRPWVERGFAVDALYRKPIAPVDIAPGATPVTDWIQFPWEHEIGPEDAVIRLIEYIGEDPKREGLKDTPARVTRAFREMCSGYRDNPQEILQRQFNEACDEMVVETGIKFTSLCEHHMLPFVGTCAIGYIPHKSVVGASKLVRLVQCFARRLQIQERMTIQIASALMQSNTAPVGVGVVVRAKHSCMGCRGVLQPSTELVTSSLLGAMRDDAKARAEFLALAR